MITNLTQKAKPLKLRHFCKETKSKILLDVCWSQLKGNKQPYLSVNIRQVKKDGVIVNGWQEQKQAISELNNKLSFIVNSGSCGLDGSGMHQQANMQYHFKLAQDQFGKDIYTQEKHNKTLSGLWQDIENHSIFNTLFKKLGTTLNKYLKEYHDKKSERYEYFNSDRAFKHWDHQIKGRYNIGMLNSWAKPLNKTNGMTPQDQLKNYFDGIQQYKDLEREYRYKTLPRKDELWNAGKLAITYNLDIQQVYEILASLNTKDLVSVISEEITRKNYIKLKELQKEYNIPLVISK